MDLFRVKLNCIDHYQATPTRYDPRLRNDIRSSQVSKGPKVPVVRVFGSTDTGQKVCVHIHGAFPYLYVPYEGSLEQDVVGAYIYRLHLSIDHALAISYRRDATDDRARFVARITLVKGVPFYGFHVGYKFFLKIYMFNPIVMTRLTDLLQQGVIMKQKFQPYEAHIQYLLQFMTDYNLYGCDYLDSSKVNFRSPVPVWKDDTQNSSISWHSMSVNPDRVTNDISLPRTSHCSIEVDICVQDITNRLMVKERRLHHGFIERKIPLPPDLKLVYSMAGLWKDEAKRRQKQLAGSKKTCSPFPLEALVTMSADPRQSQNMGWIHDEEHRSMVDELVKAEEADLEGKIPEFDAFMKPDPLEDSVNTVRQSVEDLYPKTLVAVLGLPLNVSQEDFDPASSIEVDEQLVLRVQEEDEDFFPVDSDEEKLRELHTAGQEADVNRQKVHQEKPKEEVLPPKVMKPISEDDMPYGVGLSTLKTGKIQRVPLCQELLDAAEDDGLVGRKTDATGKPCSLPTTAKRKGCDPQPTSSVKRVKLDAPENGVTRSQSLVIVQDKDISDNPFAADAPSNHETRQEEKSPLTSQKNGACLPDIVTPNQNTPQQNVKHLTEQRRAKLQFAHGYPLASGGHSISDMFPLSKTVSAFSPRLSLPSPAGLKLQPRLAKIKAALKTFDPPVRTLIYAPQPPSATASALFFRQNHIPGVLYQDAFYGVEKDVPPGIREYAGRAFCLDGNTLPFLPDFDPTGLSPATFGERKTVQSDKLLMDEEFELQRSECSLKVWEIAKPPPTCKEVCDWWDNKLARARDVQVGKAQQVPFTPKRCLSQIEGPTPKNKHDYKYTQKKKSSSVEHEASYMSVMSLEVHVNTRGKLVPNPEEDEVQCIFWCLKPDATTLNSRPSESSRISGVVVLCTDGHLSHKIRKMSKGQVIEEDSELEVMVRMVEIIRTHDPDVLIGYEIHGSSWGYLIERARFKYDYSLCDEFARVKSDAHSRFGKENDKWGFNTTSTIRVTGRHMINIWRAMRGELTLLQYTMENVVWHLLHRRIPHYSWRTLTGWYMSGRPRDLANLLRYYEVRTRLDIDILEANELIPRTSEQARVLGVDFFSVFSRGSQFKVESIMSRISKPENFIMVSPSRKQVGGQNALECLPLVMEPQSAFYTSPLLVLDFQSLYPSVMIAYNYCYSTFLGRVTNWRGVNKMGFTEYKRQQGLLTMLKDYINIAPNGMMYVKTQIRKSLLAKMLTEILETRVMVKSGMKKDKEDKTLQQLLNNRQLALKLLANVTYGYTSASFSGRMPCAEIADSIVQTGRETLEKAIAHIHSVEKWGAEVVYGDTDSLFIYLKGRTRDEAFDIGQEIAKAITDMNPRPIKLKFEKVYHPCVLLAKKRYVGYKYETKDQIKPEFDAKGIETVRRDGTPAEQKIEEKVLKMLFKTADLSPIKAYFQAQCSKIMHGAVSAQDFCFAREVRLGTYSDKAPPPAGALISTKRMLEDARTEPQYGERVPYVVITGAPGARLIDRCVAPEDLLRNPQWQLDAKYYIEKNLIPPLERIFNLMGANVSQWYEEMPKVQRANHITTSDKATLEGYMRSTHCLVCAQRFTIETTTTNNNPYHHQSQVCPSCRADIPTSIVALQKRLAREERRYEEILSVCRSCSSITPVDEVKCDSKDCPVFWTRMRQLGKVKRERAVTEPAIRDLGEEEGDDDDDDDDEVVRRALEW